MKLEELRRKVDEIDAKIVKLIAERVQIAREIGKQKEEQGKQVEDRERENHVLQKVKSVAKSEGLNPEDMANIHRQIIAASKRVQGWRIAFQGETGAYSEEAALQFFGTAVQTVLCETLDEVFKRVERGEAESGVIPIENSLEGSIVRSYDLLLDSSLMVCGEIELRVVHCLIANPGVRLDSIKKAYSHPQALGQCQSFLTKLGCEMISTYDTAGSVKMVKEKGITDGGAIASAKAAEIYGMNILARSIEDNQNNFTRFFILSKKDSPPTGNDKTSVVLSLKHRPGTLQQLLKEFADRSINLTKIESRPTRQKPWEYNFYLDFEGHRQDKPCQEALKNIESVSIFARVLGSYPRAK